MRPKSIARWTTGGSLLMLLAVGSIFGCSGGLPDTLSPISLLQHMSGGDGPGAPRLADELHTELLTARSSLLDFVTLQSAGSREQGLHHLQNAQARAEELGTLVDDRPELHQLRPFVLQFKGDLASYQVALSSVLRLADSGIHTGDVYTAQIRQWSRRGAALASDADSLQVLAYTSKVGPAPTVALADGSGFEAEDTLPYVAAIALACSVLAGLVLLLVGTLRRHRRSSYRAHFVPLPEPVDLTAVTAPAEEAATAPPVSPVVLHFGALSELLDRIVDPNQPPTDPETQHARSVAIAASCVRALLEAA